MLAVRPDRKAPTATPEVPKTRPRRGVGQGPRHRRRRSAQWPRDRPPPAWLCRSPRRPRVHRSV